MPVITTGGSLSLGSWTAQVTDLRPRFSKPSIPSPTLADVRSQAFVNGIGTFGGITYAESGIAEVAIEFDCWWVPGSEGGGTVPLHAQPTTFILKWPNSLYTTPGGAANDLTQWRNETSWIEDIAWHGGLEEVVEASVTIRISGQVLQSFTSSS